MEEKNTRELSLDELEKVSGGKHHNTGTDYPSSVNAICPECTRVYGTKTERVFVAPSDWTNHKIRPEYYLCSWCEYKVKPGDLIH